jgi:hypothetical protein
LLLQQFAHELNGCRLVAPPLHEQVENLALAGTTLYYKAEEWWEVHKPSDRTLSFAYWGASIVFLSGIFIWAWASNGGRPKDADTGLPAGFVLEQAPATLAHPVAKPEDTGCMRYRNHQWVHVTCTSANGKPSMPIPTKSPRHSDLMAPRIPT